MESHLHRFRVKLPKKPISSTSVTSAADTTSTNTSTTAAAPPPAAGAVAAIAAAAAAPAATKAPKLRLPPVARPPPAGSCPCDPEDAPCLAADTKCTRPQSPRLEDADLQISGGMAWMEKVINRQGTGEGSNAGASFMPPGQSMESSAPFADLNLNLSGRSVRSSPRPSLSLSSHHTGSVDTAATSPLSRRPYEPTHSKTHGQSHNHGLVSPTRPYSGGERERDREGGWERDREPHPPVKRARMSASASPTDVRKTSIASSLPLLPPPPPMQAPMAPMQVETHQAQHQVQHRVQPPAQLQVQPQNPPPGPPGPPQGLYQAPPLPMPQQGLAPPVHADAPSQSQSHSLPPPTHSQDLSQQLPPLQRPPVSPVSPVKPVSPAARSYVDAYFQDVNRAYPFVDRSRVLAILEARGETISEFPERDAESTLVYLIMAIGYTTLQRAGRAPASNGTSFRVSYKDILAGCLIEENTDTCQILLLLAIYSFFDPDGFSTWPIVDVLARQAMRLGLTRRETAEDGLTPVEAERNRRLFWSVYTLDRMVAVTIGMPVALNDINMNIPVPGITVDEFASPDRVDCTSMLQVTRHLISLRILEDRVLHEIHLRDYRSTRELTLADRRAIVMDLRTAIENWYSNGCLLKSTEPDEMTIHIRISWLASRYYNLLMLLYYPSHFSPVSSPLIPPAELVSLAQKHVQANAVRFQQRQLPLNNVTLCRLFPVCMVFLHFALWPGPGDRDEASLNAPNAPNAREEISICADIMAAFPPTWNLATRGSAILRQLASPLTSAVATVPGTTTTFTSKPTWTMGGSHRAWRHAIRVSFLELTQQVLGRGSAFQRLQHWETGPPAATSEQSNESGSQVQPPTPVSLFQVPSPRLVGGSIMGGATGRLATPFDISGIAADIDVSWNGMNFMDFL